MGKKVRRIVFIVLCIKILPILIISILMTRKKEETTNVDAIASFGGLSSLIVSSNAMNPNFNINDLIFLDDKLEIVIGDLICFSKNGKVIINEITDIIKNNENIYYKTQNYLVYKKEIEGVYIAKISNGGIFVKFMQTPTGYITFSTISTIPMLIWSYIKKSRKQENIKIVKI